MTVLIFFAGTSFFGADRKPYMKARRRASTKEVLELYADAKKAVGSAGGPSYGAAGKRSRSSRRAHGLDRPRVAIALSPPAS